MKAQLDETKNLVTVRVCGRLGDESVPELASCWTAALQAHPGQKISVDLRHETFIDQEGRSLLERMHRDGAKFVVSGLMTREIIDNIIRNGA